MDSKIRRRVQFAVGILVLLLIITAGFGSAVLYLWNWLMPELFGLKQISYWQALGLMGLSWILFRAGFLSGSHRGWKAGRASDPCHGMSPEQRERFRRSIEGRTAETQASGPTQSVP